MPLQRNLHGLTNALHKARCNSHRFQPRNRLWPLPTKSPGPPRGDVGSSPSWGRKQPSHESRPSQSNHADPTELRPRTKPLSGDRIHTFDVWVRLLYRRAWGGTRHASWPSPALGSWRARGSSRRGFLSPKAAQVTHRHKNNRKYIFQK